MQGGDEAFILQSLEIHQQSLVGDGGEFSGTRWQVAQTSSSGEFQVNELSVIVENEWGIFLYFFLFPVFSWWNMKIQLIFYCTMYEGLSQLQYEEFRVSI